MAGCFVCLRLYIDFRHPHLYIEHFDVFICSQIDRRGSEYSLRAVVRVEWSMVNGQLDECKGLSKLHECT